MPRRNPKGRDPDWGRLYETAAAQAGYFTTAQGAEAGYSTQLLRHHVRRGRVQRAAHGIYRLVQFPASDHEDLVVAWLWSGRLGVFSHDTALALHELSDVLPNKKHMTVPASWAKRRLRVPPGVVLHFADVGDEDTAWNGPVRLTTPLRTVVDAAAEHVAPQMVRQAVEQALRRGLFTRSEIRQAARAAGLPMTTVMGRGKSWRSGTRRRRHSSRPSKIGSARRRRAAR